MEREDRKEQEEDARGLALRSADHANCEHTPTRDALVPCLQPIPHFRALAGCPNSSTRGSYRFRHGRYLMRRLSYLVNDSIPTISFHDASGFRLRLNLWSHRWHQRSLLDYFLGSLQLSTSLPTSKLMGHLIPLSSQQVMYPCCDIKPVWFNDIWYWWYLFSSCSISCMTSNYYCLHRCRRGYTKWMQCIQEAKVCGI